MNDPVADKLAKAVVAPLNVAGNENATLPSAPLSVHQSNDTSNVSGNAEEAVSSIVNPVAPSYVDAICK